MRGEGGNLVTYFAVSEKGTRVSCGKAAGLVSRNQEQMELLPFGILDKRTPFSRKSTLGQDGILETSNFKRRFKRRLLKLRAIGLKIGSSLRIQEENR